MNYRKGSIIEYKTFDGSLRLARVTEKLDDVKNGHSGFDGVLINDNFNWEVWGYDDQIIRVVVR